jgi:hypothetical protein
LVGRGNGGQERMWKRLVTLFEDGAVQIWLLGLTSALASVGHAHLATLEHPSLRLRDADSSSIAFIVTTITTSHHAPTTSLIRGDAVRSSTAAGFVGF